LTQKKVITYNALCDAGLNRLVTEGVCTFSHRALKIRTIREKELLLLQQWKFVRALPMLAVLFVLGCTNPAPPKPVMRLPRHTEGPRGPVIDVLALGDSYTAGNGALDGSSNDGYYFKSPDDPRTDAQVRHKTFSDTWKNLGTYVQLTKDCFRNSNSYAEQHYRKEGSTGAFINGSCSGDKNVNVAQQIEGFEEIERTEIDLIVLTIGGNDVNFGGIVKDCFYNKTAVGVACEGRLKYAQQELENVILYGQPPKNPGDTRTPSSKEVINSLLDEKKGFPNAKVVLVGYPPLSNNYSLKLQYCKDYPYIWDKDKGAGKCGDTRDNSGWKNVYPARELASITGRAQELQKTAVADLSKQFPGRVFYQPTGSEHFFNWIRPTGSTKYTEEWMHPTLDGHKDIAGVLESNAGVHEMLVAAVRRDFPRKSVILVGSGGWFAVDQASRVWQVDTDFAQCERPADGYKVISWSVPHQIFMIEASSLTPKLQLGCDPNGINGGDILQQDNGTAWLVHYGVGGAKNRTRIPTTEMYNCLVASGSRVIDHVSLIKLTEFNEPAPPLAYYSPACPKAA
jgi:lysophospholipase L1-like esterase